MLSPEATERVSQAWPDLPLRNNTADRAAVLTSVRDKYTAGATCGVFAAREQANPADGRPFATPWVDPMPPSAEQAAQVAVAPPADGTPKPPPLSEGGRGPRTIPPVEKSSEAFYLFGWELPRRDAVAGNLRTDESPYGGNKLQKDTVATAAGCAAGPGAGRFLRAEVGRVPAQLASRDGWAAVSLRR